MVEPLPLKEIAQGVRLGGTHIYVTNDQCGISFKVNEVCEMVGSTRKRFLMRSIDV